MIHRERDAYDTYLTDGDQRAQGAGGQANARQKATDNWQEWAGIVRTVPIGGHVEFTSAGDESGRSMQAIVLDVARKSEKATNPHALSTWEVTFAIPDMSRQLHMPFSQISTDAYADEAASGIIVSPASWSNNLTNLNKMFDEASREGKEERLIATGNLLAAFDGLSGKGQIVQFADINGDVKPGILMPRAYSTEQFLKERRVRFQTGDQVIRFLKESEDKKITTADDVMTVSQRYDGGYEFSGSASRLKGGKYFTDGKVREVFDRWIKRGGTMEATVSGRSPGASSTPCRRSAPSGWPPTSRISRTELSIPRMIGSSRSTAGTRSTAGS